MPVEKLNYEEDRNSIPSSFSGESAGTEGPQVHVRGRAEDKELGHSLARGGALEDAPAGVAGSHHQARHLEGKVTSPRDHATWSLVTMVTWSRWPMRGAPSSECGR